ncbi:cysteine desulfurase activator SufB, partial [Dehalococcoides mccartyi]
LESGVILDDLKERSGTYIQMDNHPVHFSAQQDGIEIMSTSEAAKKYDWLKDYWWKAVSVDADKYTAHVELNQADGYFIRALPGVKTEFPVQSCMYMAKNQSIQNVHNIIIAEEGSELHIITGCTSAHRTETGLHLGVTEFYIKKGAKVTFTMIHTWSPDIAVRPRTGAIVEENGVFLSNYVIMKTVKNLQSYPVAYLNGENAVARFNSVMVCPPGSKMDVGSRVFLNAKHTRTELITRALTTGGEIISRGYIEGKVPDCKGHLECRGLILGDKGIIYAIPELMGRVSGVDLSHEAAVGKIAEEEVEYLMARGLNKDEATAAIVRGFLNVDIEGLPPLLKEEMDKA